MHNEQNSRLMRWILLLTIRQLVRPLVWVMTLLMILSVLIMHYMTLPENNTARVLIYDGGGYYGEGTADLLIKESENDDTVFDFERAKDAESLRQEVREGSADCGFIVSEDADDLIEKGDADGVIICVRSGYSTRYAVARESFFSAFFRLYGEKLLRDNQARIFGSDDSRIHEMIRDRYRELLTGDEVIEADFRTVEGESFTRPDDSAGTQPLRGLIMIILSMVMWVTGMERFYGSAASFEKALAPGNRTVFELILLGTGALVPFVTGFVLIRILSADVPLVMDAALYLGAALVSILWTFLISRLPRSGVSGLAWMPVLLAAQFIICPVWRDFSRDVFALMPLSCLFPSGLYTRILILVG